MTQNEVLEIATKVYGECDWHESALLHLEAFAKLVEERTAAKEREHWKEIVGSQLRCITALNDIVGGEGSTTTKNILDYSRMEERIQEAVDKEREACAKIVDDSADMSKNYSVLHMVLEKVSKAIRARGNK